jgi:hypothetical protein
MLEMPPLSPVQRETALADAAASMGTLDPLPPRAGGTRLPGLSIDMEYPLVKKTAQFLSLAFFAATVSLFGQSTGTSSSQTDQNSAIEPQNETVMSAIDARLNENREVPMSPFSRVAIGGGISLMGVNLQMATNLNRHLNLRATGNVFNYTINDISTNGFNVSGKANFATAGASLDYYPFALHGLRLSPGVIFYNQNEITASGIVAGGEKVTLNDQDYISNASTPISVSGKLGLNAKERAFTATIGWGNMIPRKGGHWSFPFELGAVFTGVPTLNMKLTGLACPSSDGSTCSYSYVDMGTNTMAQDNLNAQIDKYRKDLDPLRVYPIISFGVSYAF